MDASQSPFTSALPGWSTWMEQLPQAGSMQSMMASLMQPDMQALLAKFKDMDVAIDPTTVGRLQSDYLQEFSTLWQNMLQSKLPQLTDRRFASPAWQSNSFHAFNAAAYLLNSRFMMALVDAVDVPERAKRKIRFAVQQMIDAMSPANFFATNPVALQKIVETKGQSLANGVKRLLEDMQKGRISQTDESAFQIGKNVATTEGSVVFENALMQVIQYKPLTAKVFERPLLIVPPCINKFYILDLQPENSFVRYAIEQGHTVFLISWSNPDESIAKATWDDYLTDGIIKAIGVAQDISKQPQINALGFCVGGTMLSSALSVMYGRGESPVSSMTLLTTLLDFSDSGVLDVYIDEAQISMREQKIGKGGLMPGREFSTAFSSLRPNDLVWNYVESNYLKGENPPAFDLLFWNADSTNLPGPMLCYYLRNMYLENNLCKPGKLKMAGQSVDLGKIDAPAFIYASREDHIVPWTSAYLSARLINPGKQDRNRFVLGASGHIAGVINSPAKNKRNYWTSETLGAEPEAWLESAADKKGSWWPEWAAFLAENAGKQIAAPRKQGNAQYTLIEPAPGRYVQARAEQAA